MQRRLVIDGDLFTWFDITQGDEEYVVVKDLHEGVWHAGMIYVVRAVAAATAIQTPPTIHFANSQHLTMRSSARFGI